MTSTLSVVPMAFFVEGAVLLCSDRAPLLVTSSQYFPQTGNCLYQFRCLETWAVETLLASEVIYGCQCDGWQILKRSCAIR